MTTTYETLVIGLGAVGSATVEYLSRRGKRVAGVDRFRPPHSFGSTHGATRIIRRAYAEDPSYVPLLAGAYAGWRELEERCGRRLLLQNGGLMIGPEDGDLISGVKRSAELHDLEVESLGAQQLRARYGGIYQLPRDHVALLDPQAGLLLVEDCVQSMLDQASEQGADLFFDSPVRSWTPEGQGVRVELANGRNLLADSVLLATGAWMADLVPELAEALEVSRQVQHWFESAATLPTPAELPIFIWEHDAPRIFYGFPDLGSGMKIAIHHEGELTSADTVERQVTEPEVAEMRALVDSYMPGSIGSWLRSSVCMYTYTPDGHFAIGTHPEHPQVLLASACSGHGFKFASVLGPVLGNLLLDEPAGYDLSAFALDRLSQPSQQTIATMGARRND